MGNWKGSRLQRKLSFVIAVILLVQLLSGIGAVYGEETDAGTPTDQSSVEADALSAESNSEAAPAAENEAAQSLTEEIGAAAAELSADPLVEQPGGTTRWVVAGSFQGWNATLEETRLLHLGAGFYEYSRVLPAGHHEFKITKDGNWDNGFSNNGSNFSFDLTESKVVNFYVNEKSKLARINVQGVAGMPYYQASISSDKWPRLVGNLQTLFAESNWSPEAAKQMFIDYNFDGTVFKLQRTLPVGSYAAKVVLGTSWNDANYGGAGGGDLLINVLDPANVIFTFTNTDPKVLAHDYVPTNTSYDGLINNASISFDSRSVTYKKPFGAIKQGQQDLTLRIAVQKGDVQTAKVELTNPDGLASAFMMRKVTSVGAQDYFEAVLPKTAFARIGIWGYKFILVDGATKVEYGDDGMRGGAGKVTSDGAIPYDLTVYDPNYHTPDWMKNAVVYQIFPDRFFDGNESNNRAKTVDGYRGALSSASSTKAGGQKLQYFDGGVANDPTPDQVWGDWSDSPENPDRTTAENKPYYPNAKTDGAWSNEFYGGDIEGIQQKLGYLKSLGVNTLYLNPVSWAASNHKYDATDYEHLDPMFGQPVYNTPGVASSGLNYEATRAQSDRIYQAFAKAARTLNMHIINDGVFNHVGDDSIYFDRYGKYPEIGAYEYWAKVYDAMNTQHIEKSAAETLVSNQFKALNNPLTGKNYQYPDDFGYTTWFTIENEKVTEKDGTSHYKYDAWWGYDSLPVMDAKSPQDGDDEAIDGIHEWNNVQYRDMVIGHNLTGLSDEEASAAMQATNSQRWMWMGSSGWRLDVAPDVSGGTWQKFREAVKSAAGRTDANGNTIEEPIILGEEWGVATRYLLGDQFDSVMNYRFRGALQSFLISGDAGTMNQTLESIREDYPEEAWQAMLNLVDSHDTIRSITKYDFPNYEEEHLKIAPEATEQALKLQQLTAIMQLSYPGAPTIYYGDEVGLTGTKDPDSRRTFPWERVTEANGVFSGAGKYSELFRVYQQAAKLRNENEVLRTGVIKTAYAQGDAIVYARKNDTSGALIAINRGNAPVTVEADVAGFLPDGLELKDRLAASNGITAAAANGKVSLTIPALSGMILLSEASLSEVQQVEGLTAAGGNNQVTLSWNETANADSYRVYRAAIEGGTLEQVGRTESLTFTDTTVENGTKYYYAVTAVAGSSESAPGDMVQATPAFPIQSVEITQQSTPVTLGVGNETSEILVSIHVPGLTDDPALAGKEAARLTAKLRYYKEGTDKALAGETKLRYKADGQNGEKIYWAKFEPTYSGAYYYFAEVSTDNEESFTESAATYVDVYQDAQDVTPPAAVTLSPIDVESNMAQLKWTLPDDVTDITGIEVYRKDGAEGFHLIAALGSSAVNYVDYAVSNDTEYAYKVVTYDHAYNRAESAIQTVTPKLVMVDVTLRLHLPDYTPTTDNIYLAGSLNGWNEKGNMLTVPSGATDRSIVEYSFKMMAGKSIEYKYTRGVWATEAFTSHERKADDATDMGNWAYSSTDTNMRLTIANQGGNKMLVDDYVLRWVDMPMMISLPRTSYGENITYTTTESTMNLKAVVPFGVAFTINGQPIAEGAMDARGNVLMNDIPLAVGTNTFTLHIEPTQATLDLPWYTDDGRASQATKTITIQVTRTGSTPSNSGGNGGGSETPATPAQSGVQQVTQEKLKPNENGAAVVKLGQGVKELQMPVQAAAAGSAERIEVQSEGMTLNVPKQVLQSLAALLPADQREGAHLALSIVKLDKTAAQQAVSAVKDQSGAVLTIAGEVYDFELTAVTKEGKATKLSAFEAPITLSFTLQDGAQAHLAGVYYLAEDGSIAYVGGQVKDGVLTANVYHFSRYAPLVYGKTFTDLKPGHWAAEAVAALSAKHIIQGVNSTMFAPNAKVTRAEFAAMIVRAFGFSAKSAAPFSDVASDAWYAADVAAAYENGIVSGQAAGKFAPSAAITREEMAVMIVRAYQAIAKQTSSAKQTASFQDAAAVSVWAQSFVSTAAELGLMKGQSGQKFAPKANTTRAESAQVLYNLLQKLGE